MPCPRLASLIIVAAAVLFAGPGIQAVDVPTFSKDIGPILTARCLNCHGPKRQKNDLRLDSAEAVKKGGKNGPVFMAGNPDKSPMYYRITRPPGDEDRMPATGEPLTKPHIETIKAWIAGGAKFD